LAEICTSQLTLSCMQQKKFTAEIGGKTVEAIFSDLTEQANGSVMLRMGDSMVLVTAVMGTKDRLDLDYFPLSVEYEERFYAAGQILGSRFMRREGRPSDDAVLSGRIVDRTIRPLFDNRLRKDVQVVVTVLSIDQDDPDVLGVVAASLALGTSNIPWGGPVSAVRIGKKKGSDTFVVNPTYAERNADDAELDLLVCGKDGVITMIEVGSKEVAESVVAKAFEIAMAEIEKIQAFQKQVIDALGVQKAEIKIKDRNPALVELFKELEAGFAEATFPGKPGKESQKLFADAWRALVAEKLPEEKDDAARYLDERIETLIRDKAINEKKRVDGRAMDEIRPLFAQAGGISPVIHGTGIFYRGQTHIFSALTLGGPDDSQIVDSIEGAGVEVKKRFMHHYNFPPYSVGETGRFGGMNRRMIGHGALAEKALSAVIPAKDVFPYTIRLVSEAFSSNGSTSMGSVCASTLALMDGGVPITAPVAGIAMGIMYEGPERYAILTDIQGAEDHHGDMDFKVAGTKNGVTAIQLDVKLDGIPPKLMVDALEAARVARMKILDVITTAIPTPRAELSPRAPKIVSLMVPVDAIGLVIGPGGKNIKKIQEDTGVAGISIEDDGSIFITGVGDAPEKAAQIIRDMTRVYQAGDVIEGEVTRLMDFGAFVKLGAGKQEGLVHISEFAPFRIAAVKDAVSVGEKVRAVIKEIDDQGRVNLSIKMVDPEFATRKNLQPAPADGGMSGGGDFRHRGPRREGGHHGGPRRD
jgi:polyribonucleotide nucleotidyltransferase